MFSIIITASIFSLNFLNAIVMLCIWSVDEPLIILNGTVSELFYQKNWFGVLLGILICLLFSPSLIIAFIFIGINKILMLITKICELIWNLGNR